MTNAEEVCLRRRGVLLRLGGAGASTVDAVRTALGTMATKNSIGSDDITGVKCGSIA